VNQVSHGHSEGLWEVHGKSVLYRAVAQWVEAFHKDQEAAGVIGMRTPYKVVLLKSLLEVNMDNMPVGCGKDK
jgi:hypothetical protein